jgi:gluconokinase
VCFVHLVDSSSVIAERLDARRDHYMPASLLDSQLRTLEPLVPDEPGFAIRTDRSPALLAEEIARRAIAPDKADSSPTQ